MRDLERRVGQLADEFEGLRSAMADLQREFKDLQRKVARDMEICSDMAKRGTFTLIDRVEKLEQKLSQAG
ncbi:MAG: hypothetical protein JSV65_15890 [Armatimonadota bacterium]|nr:MAG: hypothetical protein JSV65_15890 [Armatimonadota bacterium]